ncbi:MAG: hypothetical protein KDA95_01945 [Acidimicrobiales bacterium]|nr:hypothetical protein [Acidimicrobiales bacterium]
MSRRTPSLHALYTVLGDEEFIEASIGSIYPFVSGITIITAYDRSWSNSPRPESTIVDMVLSRKFDPERKISLIIKHFTSEAASRNAVMDLVAPRAGVAPISPQDTYDILGPAPDYFLIVDADEIWDPGDLTRLIDYMAEHPARAYRAGAHRYFKCWNYRIAGLEWSTVAVRSDRRFRYLRNVFQSVLQRLVSKVFGRTSRIGAMLGGVCDVPAEVSVFHHGSYVGSRDRISTKLQLSGHAKDVVPDWMETVWDSWTPEMRNLNPVWPDLYSHAVRVDHADLPHAIIASVWPDGYLLQE